MKLSKMINTSKKGFTLIELLVVIGILAILLAITLIAINPARQFAQANNTQRRSDVNAILNSISQYQASNAGALPAGIVAGDTDKAISNTGAGTETGLDFCNALVPNYIAQFPKDPKPLSGTSSFTDCTAYDTKYTVTVSTPVGVQTARVTIKAPSAEIAATIEVTR